MFKDLDEDGHISTTLEFYDKIMHVNDEKQIINLTFEIKKAVINKKITNEIEIMMLNLALQIKTNNFSIESLEEIVSAPQTTIIITGEDNYYDPEEHQLNSFREEEIEYFKKGNVFPIKEIKEVDNDDT